MKTLSHHLLAGLAGLAAGIAAALCASSALSDRAAHSATAPGASAAPAPSSAAPPAVGSPASGAWAAGALLGGASDERLLRLTAALQERNLLRQRAALWDAMRDLRLEDLPALIARAEKLPREYAEGLIGTLVQRWFELDAPAAAAWVLARPADTESMNAWATADPEGALRAAVEMKDWRKSLLLNQAVEVLVRQDPKRLMALISALPGRPQREALSCALNFLADTDPDAALAAAQAYPAGRQRQDFVSQVLNAAVEKHPDWALQKLGDLLPHLKAGVLGNEVVMSIAQSIGQKDPRRALAALATMPAEFRTLPAVQVSREWAKKEALPALTWCVENGVDIAHAEWNSAGWEPSVLGGAMASAPREVFAWLSAMPAGEDRDRLLECAFMESLWHTPDQQIFAGDAVMAWDFYRALPEDSQIAKARLFIEKRMEFDTNTNPADWLPQFPAGPARENAIATAAGVLYSRDADAAEKFLAPLPAGPERDAALGSIALSASTTAPAQAAARALEITDPTNRLDTLGAVLTEWQKKDATAPRAWLQSTSLPADWKQTWLQKNTPKK